MTDVELLKQHRGGSDSAFTDLVRRHLGWVYGLARRRLRDAHLADDVAQAVFILLHRKSPQFSGDGSLIAWLHKTAWYVSETAAREQKRRQVRETEAAKIRPTESLPEAGEWEELAPLLDRLIDQLSRSDREIILLRYFREISVDELATQIGTTPGAARKRVERAVERLRILAEKSGHGIGGASLSAGLGALVKLQPPSGLTAAASVAATAPQGSVLSGSSAYLVKGALTMMTTAKLTFAAAGAVAVLFAVGLIGGATWMIAHGQTDQTSDQSPTTVPAADARNAAPAAPPAPFDAKGDFPKVAPYSGLRWRGEVPEAEVKGTWYELIAIDDVPVSEIISFQKSRDGGWQKHFGEDLPELLAGLHHQVGDTVDLEVRTLDADKKLTTLRDVPMTADNRRLLMVWPEPDQTNLFADIRWHDEIPEVQINGTWYELVSVQRHSAKQLVESAKSKFGEDWKNQFQGNLMDVLSSKAKPLNAADLQLRTLDTNEEVTMTVRVPVQEFN